MSPLLSYSRYASWWFVLTPRPYHPSHATPCPRLSRTGLLDGQYVTKEDLISVGWERTFFYLKEPQEIQANPASLTGRYLTGAAKIAQLALPAWDAGEGREQAGPDEQKKICRTG